MKKNDEETNVLGQNFSEAVEAAEAPNVLATITATQLIDVSSWEEKQKKLVVDNAFVEIVDNKTYESGKIKRTNVVKGRTELEKQDKLVASSFATIRKEVGTETAKLITISKPLEDKWQEAVKKWEDRKAKEKEEAAAAEELRIKTIKDKIEFIESEAYAIIQTANHSVVGTVTETISDLLHTDFDFEEYDILFDQAKARIEKSWDLKLIDIKDKEAQRLDNERLESEAKETKRLSELQAARLTEILPYVAFGEVVDLTKLSELDDVVYGSVLESKKALFEADAKKKQEAEESAAAKLEEEKDAIYEIRKKRLEELGMERSDEHDTFWLNENRDYILLASDVADWSAVEFEDTFSEVKEIIQSAKDRAAKQKTLEIRVDRLTKVGLEYFGDTFTIDHVKTGVASRYELLGLDVVNADDAQFEVIVNCAELAIEKAKSDAEKAEKQSKADAKLAKENEAKLKAENKARIKKYASDKKLLTEFVESLNFHNSVPEMENEDSEETLNTLVIALEDFRKEWLNNVNII